MATIKFDHHGLEEPRCLKLGIVLRPDARASGALGAGLIVLGGALDVLVQAAAVAVLAVMQVAGSRAGAGT